MHDDAAQEGEEGFEAVPDPLGEDFAGGVGEAFDVVEVVMIEAEDKGIDDPLDVAVVDEIPLGGVDLAFDADVEAEGMAVESPAFVPVGECRQLMGGFEGKRFLEANTHGRRMVAAIASRRNHPVNERGTEKVEFSVPLAFLQVCRRLV
jgi:hypothetical protein